MKESKSSNRLDRRDFVTKSLACNPKIKLIRNKYLMDGDDCCYFEYTLDA